MARLVAIQSDAVWLPMMLQRLAKESRRRDATCSTQIEPPRRGDHPRSAIDSTNRTRSTCREMNSFRSIRSNMLANSRCFRWPSASNS